MKMLELTQELGARPLLESLLCLKSSSLFDLLECEGAIPGLQKENLLLLKQRQSSSSFSESAVFLVQAKNLSSFPQISPSLNSIARRSQL